MTLISELVTFVEAAAGLTALQGERFYPIKLPARPTLPASTYMIVDTLPEYDHSGRNGLETTRIQIDCYAETYLAAHGLADAYVLAFDAWYAAKKRYAKIIGPYDLPDDPILDRSRVSLDVMIGE
jgi:hypothetical protein